ncbi:MAG: hypothetical protein HYV75_05660 [Opitutae bacterium]|nr:hypothetical protein [Opitutae bacterium]
MTRRNFIAATAGLALPAALAARVAPNRARVRRPAPSERINVAVIGFGTIARTTVPNFLNHERVQVVAVADPVSDLPNYGYTGEHRGER